MPDMSGLEVLGQLAAMQYRGAIVLFSGEDPGNLERAEALATTRGLNTVGAIPKPVSVDAIAALLERLEVRR